MTSLSPDKGMSLLYTTMLTFNNCFIQEAIETLRPIVSHPYCISIYQITPHIHIISLQERKDTRKFHFCPFAQCRQAVKKLSQHLQYKHPELGGRKKRVMRARAQVAKGKGQLKPHPIQHKQETLSHMLAAHQGGTKTSMNVCVR